MHVWTDCHSVVKRLRRLLNGGHVRPNSAHADLWQQIVDVLTHFQAGQVMVTKVAAHQPVASACTPLQEWCFHHNILADHAAARAHHGRPTSFWDFYAKHVTAVIAAGTCRGLFSPFCWQSVALS